MEFSGDPSFAGFERWGITVIAGALRFLRDRAYTKLLPDRSHVQVGRKPTFLLGAFLAPG